MSTEMIQHRSNVTPLILRVAVAGALAFAGVAQLRSGSDQLSSAPLPSGELVELPVEADLTGALSTQGAATAPAESLGIPDKIGAAIADQAKQVLSTAHVDASGVEVKMGWEKFTGLAELGVAGVLFMGFFVRLISLVGVGVSSLGALAGTGVLGSEGTLAPFANLFNANPLALMLLGAICVTLLCSGGGPLSVDRLMFGRRKSAEAVA